MKKKFKMEDLDCANCAAKMEAAIKKIKGVNEVSINFLAQKMIIDEFNEALTKCDVIITPSVAVSSWKFGEKSTNPAEVYAADICTVTLNVAGLPGMSVPCGFDNNNMPVGFQIIGKRFGESDILTVAKCYENAVGGFAVKEF